VVFTKNRTQLHVASAELLGCHGIAPPDEWVQLRVRYGQLLAMEFPCRDRLVDEMLHPTGADVAILRASALAEAASVYQGILGDVTQIVDNHVHNRMIEVYDTIAAKNYGAASRKFNQLCGEFVDLTKLVDVDAAADAVVGVDEKKRRAWLKAEGVAGELSEWANVLLAAAHLNNMSPEDDPDTTAIPLCVRNCEQLHRRKLWTAWETSGTRTGRWGPLIAAGAKLAAAEHPEGIESYRRPQPMGIRFAPVAALGGGHHPEPFDPEDVEHQTLLERIRTKVVGVGASVPATTDEWSTD
jgi:hypothetical protein